VTKQIGVYPSDVRTRQHQGIICTWTKEENKRSSNRVNGLCERAGKYLRHDESWRQTTGSYVCVLPPQEKETFRLRFPLIFLNFTKNIKDYIDLYTSSLHLPSYLSSDCLEFLSILLSPLRKKLMFFFCLHILHYII